MDVRRWIAALSRLETRRLHGWDEGVGYTSIGRATLDFSLLKNVVRQRGYLMPFDPVLTTGGGGYGRRGKRLFGGSGQGGGGALKDEHYRTNYGYGGGTLTYGYIVHESKRLRIYPYVGVGGMGEGLSVRPRNRRDSAQYPAAGAGGPALHMGWSLEYRLTMLPRWALVVGLHVGVLISPMRMGWWGPRLEGERLPRTRLVKPYFKLLLGIGVER